MKRCAWPGENPLMQEYHDKEWGVPLHDDKLFFEFLVLDAAQAGLNWAMILNKRTGYRRAFANFDVKKVARFTDKKVEKLLQDPGIVRNRLKVNSAVTNAKAFLEVQKEFGSFDTFIWQFVGGKPIQNKWKKEKDIPTSSAESDAMSRDLKKRGFKFVGTTICYAFMQAAGLVNDHTTDCFRHREVQKRVKKSR